MVRTRIAPSPTGFPHIATIYQALFDYAYAKRNQGKFIIRIEDTDRERFVQGAEEKLYEAVDWFGLTEDESPRKGGDYGPYKQSERLSLYQKYAQQLIDSGQAYYCFCSKERLEEMRKKQQTEKRPIIMYDKHCRNLSPDDIQKKIAEGLEKVIRLKVPENQRIIVHDEIRGDVEFDSNLIDDQVMLKSDGFPTYHLAVVVDDHEMGVTDVVRGEEWLSSFPKQKITYDYFGWEMPKFYHTSVLRNPDHSKLSKRQGHTDVSWYKNEGFLPEAILNYIALLGWGHPQEKEIFSLNEFVSVFDLKDMRAIGPVFDIAKLKWLNGVYIRNLGIEELSERLTEFNSNYKSLSKEMLDKIVLLAQTRMETLKDFEMLTQYFFEDFSNNIPDDKKEITADLRQSLSKIKMWNSGEILLALKSILQKHKIKMPILYSLLTGNSSGLPLPESLEILGKEKTLKRLSD